MNYSEGCRTAKAQVIAHANNAISILRSKRDRVYFGAKYDKAIARVNDIKYEIETAINPNVVTNERLAQCATYSLQNAVDRINEICGSVLYGI